MTTRETLLAAHAEGTLLQAASELAIQDCETCADLLVNLHNSGEIDFLTACTSEELDRLSQHSFFDLQHVFCESLPRIESPATDAAAACARMFAKAGTDATAGLVYRSLSEWFQRSPDRIEEGLSLIRLDPDNHTSLVRPVLLAGAAHDAERFTKEALELSRAPQSSVRLDALFVLGQIAPDGQHQLLKRVIERLTEFIAAPRTDHDAAVALEAALHLLNRFGANIANDVQDLLVNACSNPTPAVLRLLADGLRNRHSNYTDTMTDLSFKTLRLTNNQDSATIREIDLLLYQGDLDGDRNRLIEFLQHLLTHGNHPVEIDQLRNFRHKLGKESGELLGWYVVSLLLTGNHTLCNAAFRLLPYQETREGLDIDLEPFSLGPSWIPFLTRKILGYCLLNIENASALLLSCLRSVSDEERPEVEDLIMNHYLMNYLTAIKWFESAVSQGDPAKQSVDRLSALLKRYLDDLTESGTCQAFAPSEREQQIQRHRQSDFWRDVHKKAQEGSILSTVAHTATVLYGSGSIAYVYDKENKGPHRKEIPFVAQEYAAEFPRLYALDPVGLNYTTNLFKKETPPT